MKKADNPYRLKVRGEEVREEQVLIQLRDDSARPPSSVGVDFLSGFLFGAVSRQPSRSPERRLTWGGIVTLGAIFVALALWVVSVLKR